MNDVKKRRARAACAIVLVLALAAPAAAAPEKAAPLTSDQILGFITSLPDLDALSDEFGEDPWVKTPAGKDPGSLPESPLAAAAALMEGHAAAGRIREVVGRHGFSGIMAWAQAGDRIIRAYLANKMDEENPEMAAQMKQAMEEIEKSSMPAEQKEAMKQMVIASQKAMAAYASAPPADREAVKEHMKELEDTLNRISGD